MSEDDTVRILKKIPLAEMNTLLYAAWQEISTRQGLNHNSVEYVDEYHKLCELHGWTYAEYTARILKSEI